MTLPTSVTNYLLNAFVTKAEVPLTSDELAGLENLISESPTLLAQMESFINAGGQIIYSNEPIVGSTGEFTPATSTHPAYLNIESGPAIDISDTTGSEITESDLPTLTPVTNIFATHANRESSTGTLNSLLGPILATIAHELGHYADSSSNPIDSVTQTPFNQFQLVVDGLLGEGNAVYNEAIAASQIAASSAGVDQIEFDVTGNSNTDVAMELAAIANPQQAESVTLGTAYALLNPSTSAFPSETYLEYYWVQEAPVASAFTYVKFTNDPVNLGDSIPPVVSALQENISNVTGVTINASSETMPESLILQHNDGTTSTIAFSSDGTTTDTISNTSTGDFSIQVLSSSGADYYSDTLYSNALVYGNVTVTQNGNISVGKYGLFTPTITITSPSEQLTGFSELEDGSLATIIDSTTNESSITISTAIDGSDQVVMDNTNAMLASHTNAIFNGSGNTITVVSNDNITLVAGSDESLNDTINVSTGANLTTDTLTFEGQSVAGSAQSGVADTANGFTYTLTDTTLSIAGTGGDQLTLNDFVDGDFGITITKPDDPAYPPDPRDPKDPPRVPSKAIQQTTSQADTSMTDPIVFDMGGNGIQLTALASSTAYFDLQGTGVAQHTGWVGPTTGILQRASIIAQLSHAMQPVFH